MRTYGQTHMTKLIVPFLSFAQVPKNHFSSFKNSFTRKHEKKTPKIIGSQSGSLKGCFVLEYDNMHFSMKVFEALRRNVPPPSSGKRKWRVTAFSSGHVESTFLLNVGILVYLQNRPHIPTPQHTNLLRIPAGRVSHCYVNASRTWANTKKRLPDFLGYEHWRSQLLEQLHEVVPSPCRRNNTTVNSWRCGGTAAKFPQPQAHSASKQNTTQVM